MDQQQEWDGMKSVSDIFQLPDGLVRVRLGRCEFRDETQDLLDGRIFVDGALPEQEVTLVQLFQDSPVRLSWLWRAGPAGRYLEHPPPGGTLDLPIDESEDYAVHCGSCRSIFTVDAYSPGGLRLWCMTCSWVSRVIYATQSIRRQFQGWLPL